MEAAGRRALRVNRQRASSRAFELAAPVWEAAAASYGDALRVRWAGFGGPGFCSAGIPPRGGRGGLPEQSSKQRKGGPAPQDLLG